MAVPNRIWRTPVNFPPGIIPTQSHVGHCAEGSTVYFFWKNGTSVTFHKSVDEGFTWSPGVVIATADELPLTSCAGVQGGVIHLAYVRGQILYVRRSIDGGTTWSAEIALHDDGGGRFYRISVTADRGIVHIFGSSSANSPSFATTGLLYWRSPDMGVSWETERSLYTSGSNHGRPAGDYDEATGVLFVAWADRRLGTEAYFGNPGETYIGRSLDLGITWETEQQLSSTASGGNGGTTLRPECAASQGKVLAVWQRPNTIIPGTPPTSSGDEDIVYRVSTNNGVTYGAEQTLVAATSTQEHVMARANAGRFVAVWADYRSGTGKLYARVSLDGAATFDAEQSLRPSGTTGAPRLEATDNYAVVLDPDSSGGNLQIVRSQLIVLEPAAPIYDDANRANTGPPPDVTKWTSGVQTAGAGEGLVVIGNQIARASGGQYRQGASSTQTFGPDGIHILEVAALPTSDSSGYFLGIRLKEIGVGTIDGYMMAVEKDIAGVGSLWSLWRLDNGGSPTISSVIPRLALAIGDLYAIEAVKYVIRGWHKPISTGIWEDVFEVEDTTYPGPGKIGIELVEDQAARIENVWAGTYSEPIALVNRNPGFGPF